MSILKHNGFPLSYNGAPIYWEAGGGPSYPTDGLIERWDFNDTLVGTVNGKTLSLSTGSTIYDTGVIDKCISYNGSSRHTITDASIYGTWAGTNNYSFSFWANISAFAWFKPPISTNSDAYKGGPDIGFGDYRAPTNKIINSWHYPGVWMEEMQSPGDGSSLSINTWYHFVVQRTSTTSIRTYINGTPYSKTVSNRSLATRTFNIGGSNQGTPSYWTGKMDLLYVYNRAITQDEVNTLYNGGAGV